MYICVYTIYTHKKNVFFMMLSFFVVKALMYNMKTLACYQ